MKEVVAFTEEYSAAWTEYVRRSSGANYAHPIGWRDVMRDGLGHKPEYLMALDGDRVCGILPLVLVRTWWGKKYAISLPWMDYGGILADDFETEQLLLDHASKLTDRAGADFLELRTVSAENSKLTLRTDKVTFWLSLDHDVDKIWGAFDAKLRNQIRKSEKCGLTTEFGGLDSLPDFYRVFGRNMRDLGTPVWGDRFFGKILETMGRDARIILVKQDARVIAGGLVLSFKDRLYVPSASSYRSALKTCPNHALYWSVIKFGCEHGYKCFDFGRSSWDSSTFRFKKQWVPNPTQLTWQYYLSRIDEVPSINPANPKYRLFISLWKRLPLSVANFLGPRVIKNFP